MLGVVRTFTVNLGVWCRGLGRGVDNRVRFVDSEDLVDEILVRKLALDKGEVREAVGVLRGFEAGFDGMDGGRGDGANLINPLATDEVVDQQDAVVCSRSDAECGGPADVPVRASDEDRHN